MRLALLALALLISACGSDEPPPEQKPAEGRAETRNIRNTDAVGYSGGAIANKVDDALKANDENVKKVEKESTEQ